MYTILIIEDEPRVASLLMNGLEENGYQTMVAYDGLMGLRLFQAHTFDLVISDIVLPKMDGFELTKEIRKSNPRIPILMLTALGSTNDKLDGFDAGADDYVTKPFSTEVLLARIRANLRRTELDGVNTSTPQTFGDLTLDMENSSATINGTTLKLRSKELQLLFALAEREGMLCRRTWLTQKVWKEDYLSTSRTIDVHIRRLRSVLDEYSDYRFIHTVHGMGYRFEPIKKTQE